VHLSAERLKIPYSQIKERYTELERDLLMDFSNFATKHLSFTWVHWNMRDSNYGFPAIYHRCRLHEIEPTEIAPTSLVDLARCLVEIYGSNYIDHPRLPSLMARNNITDLGYITGSSEPKAFEDGDYVGLHRSTLRKVDTFETILTRAHTGTLKTNYRWRDIYGKSAKDVIFFLKEHWAYSLLGMIMLVIGIFRAVYAVKSGS
jgi:hypothetical protein